MRNQGRRVALVDLFRDSANAVACAELMARAYPAWRFTVDGLSFWDIAAAERLKIGQDVRLDDVIARETRVRL